MITYIGYVKECINLDKFMEIYLKIGMDMRRIKEYSDVRIYFDKDAKFNFRPNVILTCDDSIDIHIVLYKLFTMCERCEACPYVCGSNLPYMMFITTKCNNKSNIECEGVVCVDNEHILFSSHYPHVFYKSIDMVRKTFDRVKYIVINDPYSKIVINDKEYVGETFKGGELYGFA
jgi:hypothetical protein